MSKLYENWRKNTYCCGYCKMSYRPPTQSPNCLYENHDCYNRRYSGKHSKRKNNCLKIDSNISLQKRYYKRNKIPCIQWQLTVCVKMWIQAICGPPLLTGHVQDRNDHIPFVWVHGKWKTPVNANKPSIDEYTNNKNQNAKLHKRLLYYHCIFLLQWYNKT